MQSCKKWVHKWFSGVKGALQKVEVIIQYKRCVGGVIKHHDIAGLMG
jgi:hypothetical protein